MLVLWWPSHQAQPWAGFLVLKLTPVSVSKTKGPALGSHNPVEGKPMADDFTAAVLKEYNEMQTGGYHGGSSQGGEPPKKIQKTDSAQMNGSDNESKKELEYYAQILGAIDEIGGPARFAEFHDNVIKTAMAVIDTRSYAEFNKFIANLIDSPSFLIKEEDMPKGPWASAMTHLLSSLLKRGVMALCLIRAFEGMASRVKHIPIVYKDQKKLEECQRIVMTFHRSVDGLDPSTVDMLFSSLNTALYFHPEHRKLADSIIHISKMQKP